MLALTCAAVRAEKRARSSPPPQPHAACSPTAPGQLAATAGQHVFERMPSMRAHDAATGFTILSIHILDIGVNLPLIIVIPLRVRLVLYAATPARAGSSADCSSALVLSRVPARTTACSSAPLSSDAAVSESIAMSATRRSPRRGGPPASPPLLSCISRMQQYPPAVP